MPEDLAARARAIIEDNAYMILATADGEGLPWATPARSARSSAPSGVARSASESASWASTHARFAQDSRPRSTAGVTVTIAN